MIKRQAITAQMKLDALLFRLATLQGLAFHNAPGGIGAEIIGGISLVCGICGCYLRPGDKIQWDHIHAVSMDGPHDFRNLRPTHAACNQAKGAKEHRAKCKVDRILGLTCNGPKRKIPSRPFAKRRAA
jgi:hypothetical protein